MIFDRFFSPYAEYCLRTTLSEDELKNALAKELPGYLFASVKAVFCKEEVFFCRTGKPLILHPVLRGRNSLRGEIRIQCRETETADETALDVTIKPQNLGWLVWIIFIFAVAMTVLLLRAGTWMAAAPLIVIGFQFAVLAACRSIGESEVPEIQRAFEETLRWLEKKYKDNNP